MSQQNPDTPVGGAIEDVSLDKESVIELLGDEGNEEPETLDLGEGKRTKAKDTGDKEPEGEVKDTKGKEEDSTLEDELEDELKDDIEIDEDEEQLIEAPKRKEILAKYPDIFKDFPQLEVAMYREKKYAEILPTIEDARAAVEKSQILDDHEEEILKGSTESMLSAVRDNDKEAFARLVDNYLPNLHKVDQHAYYHTIGNVIKHTIISLVRDAKATGRDELGDAASILNQYMFGTTQFTHPQNLAKEDVADPKVKDKEEEISQREQEFIDRQFNAVKDDLGTKVDNILRNTVDKAIDPNQSMTEYVRKIASREVLEGLEDMMAKDTRFSNIYDRLWEKAYESNFSQESVDRIKSAYLSKAKTLLPVLIRKARNEALRGSRRSEEKDRKGPLPVGRTRSSTTLASGSAKGSNNKQTVPSGMSTLDFLNSDD